MQVEGSWWPLWVILIFLPNPLFHCQCFCRLCLHLTSTAQKYQELALALLEPACMTPWTSPSATWPWHLDGVIVATHLHNAMWGSTIPKIHPRIRKERLLSSRSKKAYTSIYHLSNFDSACPSYLPENAWRQECGFAVLCLQIWIVSCNLSSTAISKEIIEIGSSRTYPGFRLLELSRFSVYHLTLTWSYTRQTC